MISYYVAKDIHYVNLLIWCNKVKGKLVSSYCWSYESLDTLRSCLASSNLLEYREMIWDKQLQKTEIDEISKTLMNFMNTNPFVKYKITVCFSFGQFKDKKLVGNDDFHLPSKTETLKLIDFDLIQNSVARKCFEITERFDDITLRGSNWVLLGIKFIDLNIVSLKQPTAYFNPRHATNKNTIFRKK